jgi:hypothetical protein
LLDDTRGSATVEIALWLGIVGLPVLGAVDIGHYIFSRMQVGMAAQSAVQAAWQACDTTAKLPAVHNCPALQGAVNRAVQSTSLGVKVTVAATSISEGYFCVVGGKLLSFGAAAGVGGTPTRTAPACGGTTTPPGDYIQVTTSYIYQPVFPAASVAGLLDTPIMRTAWMRLG